VIAPEQFHEPQRAQEASSRTNGDENGQDSQHGSNVFTIRNNTKRTITEGASGDYGR